MKKVILHIGTGKTGSSTIQNTLYSLRRVLKKRYGVDYALCGLSEVNHYGEIIHAHYQFVDWLKKRRLEKLEIARSYIQNSTCKTIVFSCESFYHDLRDEEIALLHNLFSDFQLCIVCYVRRQDLYVESAYKQQVKVGAFTMPFSDFADDHSNVNYLFEAHANYYRLLSLWADYFGVDSVRVIPFERRYMKNGDLVEDFFSIFGAVEALSCGNASLSNVGFPSQLVETIRYYNYLGIVPDDRRQYFIAFLKAQAQYRDFPLANDGIRRGILKNYAEANSKLFEKFGIDQIWELPEFVLSENDESMDDVEPSVSERELLAKMLYEEWVHQHNAVTTKAFLKKLRGSGLDLLWLLKTIVGRVPEIDKLTRCEYRKLICKLLFSGLFSPTYYYSNNLDLADSEVNPFEHYVKFGWKEGRAPNPNAAVREVEAISTVCEGEGRHPLQTFLRHY